MLQFHILKRLDWRLVFLVFALMLVSLLVISSSTSSGYESEGSLFFSSSVKKQLQFFLVGWCCFFFFSAIDYNKLREWTWILYIVVVLLLFGLFAMPSIQNVHRWYRIGGFAFQPSEVGKLAVVLALSWYLDRRGNKASYLSSALGASAIVLIPFLLIFKQPDLGTALVLYPIALGLFYFGGIHKWVLVFMAGLAALGFTFISLIFLGALDHEEMRPIATKFIKEYQYERFNPATYHQKAAQTAIAIGGIKGAGWNQSDFTKRKWLPAAHTDSVFPAFAEEFGLVGVTLLLALFYGMIDLCFRVTVVARDRFGRLLSAGIAIYLAMHILVNLGMMSGYLPITGVPLVLVSYGGSSILATMSALGILQSIYSRRFTF